MLVLKAGVLPGFVAWLLMYRNSGLFLGEDEAVGRVDCRVKKFRYISRCAVLCCAVLCCKKRTYRAYLL